MRENYPQKPSPEEALAEAKRDFLARAGEVDFFSFVKKHPRTGVGCAFLAGIGAGTLGKRPESLAMVPIVMQIAELLLKYISLSRERP